MRLFDEVQARTRDLEEALQQQTATAEVLKVISRSAFDLQAVFDTLIASAVELCGAFSGSICVRDGDVFRYRGNAGVGASGLHELSRASIPRRPGADRWRAACCCRARWSKFPTSRGPGIRRADGRARQPARALLGVPLLGKGGVEGALVLDAPEPGHFTDRQIEIVQTFADQAVIAIENVRLFDEVQARTRELAASLDDLRKAQDRLVQSEKLASLGQLTAGIAHEIKNPLNFVNNFSALSRELLDELREMLADAPLGRRPARRGGRADRHGRRPISTRSCTRQARRFDRQEHAAAFARGLGRARRASNINAMVEEALNLAYHGARAEKPGFNVTIVKSLDPNAGAADLYRRR